MRNIEDQLKELPTEFIYEMEHQKSDRWTDVFNFICEYFECKPLLDELDEYGIDMTDLLKRCHDFGFYGGVNFALDPQEEYIRKSK